MKSLFSLLTRTVRKPTSTPGSARLTDGSTEHDSALSAADLDKVTGGGGKGGVGGPMN